MEVVKTCLRIASEKRAQDILILEMKSFLGVADYFVVATARNKRQMSAIADEIRVDLKKREIRNLRAEGYGTDRWVLLDFGDVVVHLFDSETRAFYDLESLWADAPRVPVNSLLEGSQN